MSRSLVAFRVAALPNKEINKGALFEGIGRNAFALVYDFAQKATFLCIGSKIAEEKISAIEKSITGICFEPSECEALQHPAGATAFSCYRRQEIPERQETCVIPPLHDIFDSSPDRGFVATVFIPAEERKLDEVKSYVEAALGSRDVRETRTAPAGPFNARPSSSTQRELFSASEETAFLNCVLSSINNAILTNGLAYKLFFVTASSDSFAKEYLSVRFLTLNEFGAKSSFEEQFEALGKAKAFPFDTGYLANFLNFYGSYALNYLIATRSPEIADGIAVGTFMKGGVLDSGSAVRITPSSLNLGTMITGLPGSGKTREAMAIVDSVRKSAPHTRTLVIAPTDEWNGFALSHGMHLARPYADSVPINFFRCPPGLSRERFYESLALVLSTASCAGPYQNPMAHCLLNAFRRVYASTDNPSPVQVYTEIEEAIMRFHAKKTNTGVKYTKHGENIRSALEGLRAILSRPEYAMQDGVKFEELSASGIVFDVSGVSGEKRPYIYALLLNQAYALAAGFDTGGDDELRLLICLEEAQTVLGSRESAATQDLKQRIQDFRKQGVGLMLLAHNVTDIEQGVRRLCQTKLYLRQAPDVAETAVKDLVFTYATEEDVSLKLKLLDSRIGAFSHVLKRGTEKLAQDTIFIRTAEYLECVAARANPIDRYMRERGIRVPSAMRTEFHVSSDPKGDAGRLQRACYVRLQHLGEEVFMHKICADEVITQNLIEGVEYTLQVLNQKGHAIHELNIKACPRIGVRINEDSLVVE